MLKKKRRCPIYDSKSITARKIMDIAVEEIKSKNIYIINLIWLGGKRIIGPLEENLLPRIC